MHCTKQSFINRIIFWVLGMLLMTSVPVLAQEHGQGAEFIVDEPPVEVVTYQNYSGLSELVTMICDDAILRFQGFYGPTIVTAEPLITIGQYQHNKRSKLGITITDQMIAMVNNDTIMLNEGDYVFSGKGTTQRLNGVLEEVDGYLRVHINGVNVLGERLSYVANVEMSEAIYRALHTYL